MTQQVPIAENRRRLSRVVSPFPADYRVTFTADTAASATLTSASPVTNLSPGMVLSSPTNITPGTTIVSVAADGTVVMSGAALSSLNGVTIYASYAGGGTAVCHLYNVAYSGGPDPTPASFTEETASWYAPITLSAGAGPYTLPNGQAEIDFGDLAWILSAIPTAPSTEYGYWIDYKDPLSGLTVVAVWENFPTPVVMAAVGNAIVISVPINQPDATSASTI